MASNPLIVEIVERGDTGPGLPAGGTAGQVPKKLSDDDFDIGWFDAGDGGGGFGTAVGETPAGAVNGSNATFTTAHDFTPGQVAVAVNGLLQRAGTDFTTSGVRTILLADSPLTGDAVRVTYTRAS